MIVQLGGIFIKSNQSKALAEWYKTVMKMPLIYTVEFNCWYATWGHTDENHEKSYTNFSIMHSDKLFTEHKITINLRVKNIHEFISHIQTYQVEVKEAQIYEEGIFAWLNDLDGNKIELWEDINAIKQN